MMLAPLVMAALARARTSQTAGATAATAGAAGTGSVGDVLQREQSHIERQVPGLGGLTSILDRDGDGQIADDIANLAVGGLGGSGGGLGGMLGDILGDRR